MTGTALITGVAGQDGLLLARHLTANGTEVVGTLRPGSDRGDRMAPYLAGIPTEEHDLRDADGFARLLRRYRPDEIYNLAGVTSVRRSWDEPDLTTQTNATAVVELLEATRAVVPEARFFQAASAEQLGEASHSPYAASKAAAQDAVRRFRKEGTFAVAGVLYGHESPVRPDAFVTRKISRAVAEISLGRRESLTLGNTAVSRDWGDAAEFVTAMPLMLRATDPADLVLATGVLHSLDEMVQAAFAAIGITDPTPHLGFDPGELRPADATVLLGDTSEAARTIGWTATITGPEVIARMVASDVIRLRTGVEEHPTYLDRYPDQSSVVHAPEVSGR